MANHVSAQKRARQTLKITEHHRHFRTVTRTQMKRVRAAIAAGDRKEAVQGLKVCIQAMDTAVSEGRWHAKAGSRYVSRRSAPGHALQ